MIKTVIILVTLCLSAVLADEHNHNVSFRQQSPVANRQTTKKQPGPRWVLCFLVLSHNENLRVI